MTFMDLEDPRCAYMFGFLQMDGHLAAGVGRKGRLSVEIGARDIVILREFQRLTPYRSTIRMRTRVTNFSESHTSATWTLCSLEARTRMQELGLPAGRKSAVIAPPSVPFARTDYLRGVLDADGSVGLTAPGLPFLSLATVSTAVAGFFCSYAEEHTGAVRNLRRNARDGIYNVLYTKEHAQRLAATLYYPGCLALRRKQEAATAMRTWVRPPGMKRRVPGRRWEPWEDDVLLAAPSPRAAAGLLGRSIQSCAMRVWRHRRGELPAQ